MPMTMLLSLLKEVPRIGRILDAINENVVTGVGIFMIFGAIVILVSYMLIIIPSFIANRWAFGTKVPFINRFLGIYTEDYPQWCKTERNKAGKLHTGKVVPWKEIPQEVKDKLEMKKGIMSKISKRHSAVYETPSIVMDIATWVKKQEHE